MFQEIEIEELEEKIVAGRKGYYVGKPIMSDPEYDALEMRLKELDPGNKLFDEVGEELKESTFTKVQHNTPMLSLDKAYSVEEVMSWAPTLYGLGMPKMDGFALSLIYKKIGNEYVLIRGSTRGKGEVGEDITENVKQVDEIPKRIVIDDKDVPDTLEVRGETYMKRSVFKDLGLDKEFENCRNIAPGSMREC